MEIAGAKGHINRFAESLPRPTNSMSNKEHFYSIDRSMGYQSNLHQSNKDVNGVCFTKAKRKFLGDF